LLPGHLLRGQAHGGQVDRVGCDHLHPVAFELRQRNRVLRFSLVTLRMRDQFSSHRQSLPLGGAQPLVPAARADQQQGKLINQELLSKVQDLDFTEAISRLSYQNFVLEAAQRSLAKVAGISLFDYL
jgi:hypothetical protein